MFKISFVGGLVVGLLGIGFLLSFSPNMALARTCSCSWSESVNDCGSCNSSGCTLTSSSTSGSCEVSVGNSSCSYYYTTEDYSVDENSVSEPYSCYTKTKSGTCSASCYPTCADLNCDCGCVGVNSSLECDTCNNDTYATLNVTTSGAGSGTVTENVASNKRINCSRNATSPLTDCSETKTNSDLDIVLFAYATTDIANSVFTGWSGGDCAGITTSTCTVNVDDEYTETVTANFDVAAAVSKTLTVKSKYQSGTKITGKDINVWYNGYFPDVKTTYSRTDTAVYTPMVQVLSTSEFLQFEGCTPK